jgi:glycosyltransferase involved in cell wall biosynthesis
MALGDVAQLRGPHTRNQARELSRAANSGVWRTRRALRRAAKAALDSVGPWIFRTDAARWLLKAALASRPVLAARVLRHVSPAESGRRERPDLSAVLDRCNAPRRFSSGPCLWIDVSSLVHDDARTGIQRVVRALLSCFPNFVKNEYEPAPVFGNGSGRFMVAGRWLARSGYRGYSAGDGDAPMDARAGDVFLGLDFSAHLYPAYRPEIARLRMIGVRVYFVVYDLIPLSHPRYFDERVVRTFTSWINAIVAHSEGLFCISRTVSQDLESWISANHPGHRQQLRIEWFHLGSDIAATRPSSGMPGEAAKIVDRLQAAPSFLVVGTLEPRKGHDMVLDEFDQLWRRGLDVNLVFVGRLGWKIEALARRVLRHPQLNRRLLWLNGISDEYLDAVYSASTALIAASVVEGFGLPLVEAARHGLPVIARDIPVFREVGGDGVVYFDGSRPGRLAQAVDELLGSAGSRERKRGSAGIAIQTWEESARKVCDLIREAGQRAAG